MIGLGKLIITYKIKSKVLQMARENGDFKRPEGGARANSSVLQPQRSQNQAVAPVTSGARPANLQNISHSVEPGLRGVIYKLFSLHPK